jgi:aspartyl-tRNA(Asn)/glutamyl-tRNA(Gln) amidotransferase subunit C
VKIDVAHIARLARLELPREEAVRLSGQVERILGYVEKLEELDLEGVAPFIYPGDSRNVVREDRVRDSMDREKVLGNAPERSEDSFLVPRILEE